MCASLQQESRQGGRGRVTVLGISAERGDNGMGKSIAMNQVGTKGGWFSCVWENTVV